MAEKNLKEKTAKGLFWGGFSNGVQQLLNLLFGIVLARLLTPSDYGMVGMLAIFSAIAGTLQESGFMAALTNKKDITPADYNAVFWFNILVSVTAYIILFFCAPYIAAYYRQPELTALARYLFLGFVLASTSIAQSTYLFKNLMVKQKAISQIPALLLSGTVGIIMAYNGMAYWGIATQTLVYISTISICFWYFSPWRPSWHIDLRPLKGMFGFSSKVLLTNIFTQINNNVFSAIIGRYFSPHSVGDFTQSNKWSNMGSALISGMISSTVQPVLVEISDNRERQRNVFRKLLRFTAFLSFPAMFGLALIAPEFIEITIGSKWKPCIPFLQILCIWGAFFPLTTLYTNLIISKGKSNIYMWNTILLGILQIIAILATASHGLTHMIGVFCLLNISWLLVWHFFAGREIHLSLWKAVWDILPFMASAIVTVGITWYLTRSFTHLYGLLAAKLFTAILIYCSIMWIGKSQIFKETLQYLRKRK